MRRRMHWTLRLEQARHGIDGLLIADIGRSYVLDQAALMELLALRQNGLHKRHAHRPTEVACDVNERGWW